MTSPRAAAAVELALALATAAVMAWGVLARGWSPFVVMLLFWFENVVIGVLHVVRMVVTGARHGTANLLGSVFMSVFFTLHYGVFTAVHGMFVLLLFGGADVGAALDGGLFAPLVTMLGTVFADRDGWLAAIAIVLLQASAVRPHRDPPCDLDRQRFPHPDAEDAGGGRAAADRAQARQ
jgi:hypothetical protein